MEYLEFLLQKDGDRSWLPLKSPRMEIEEGRYRVVAHSSRTNTDVEVYVTHDSTAEVPPKRRSQKRSRRTNREGLMVVIPFTYLKPGLWELRCCGDIMSDFLGNSWQQAVQLQVFSKATEVERIDAPVSPVVDATQTPVQAGLRENLPSSSDSERSVEPEPLKIETSPLTPLTEESESEQAVEPEPLKIETPPVTPQQAQAALPEPEILVKSETNVDEAESVPATLEDTEVPLEPAFLGSNKSTLTGNSTEEGSQTNPILDKSLQMLEQILQQVLEPVLQEFERSEPPDPYPKPESELSLKTDTARQGLILTLDEDTLVARRRESLTIAGTVDLLDVNQIDSSRTSSASNYVFQGTLRYDLRDPQTSRLLLDVQQPLSEQALPLTFSHTLEIPSDCNTRLILGQVTLYGLTSVALASQPFTITADLDELLEAIIPGTQVMPVAKIQVPANNLAVFQDYEAEPPELAAPPLDPALLDLIDDPESRQPLSLKPVSRQPLPPQIYQPAPTQRSSKSLQLPKLPKVQPVATTPDSSAAPSIPDGVEVMSEDLGAISQPVALADDLSPATPNPLSADMAPYTAPELRLQEGERGSKSANSEGDSGSAAASSSSAWEATEFLDPPVPRADSLPATSEALETPASSESTADSKLDTVPQKPKIAMSRKALALAKALRASARRDVNVSDSGRSNSEPAGRSPVELSPSPQGFLLGKREEVQDRESQQDRSDAPLVPTTGLSEAAGITPTRSEATDPMATVTPAADSQSSDLDATELWDIPEPEIPSPEFPVAEPVIDERYAVDNAFQALKLQDRFWLRLNSLATDAELSESLKSDLYPSSNPAEVKEVRQPLNLDSVPSELEEVRQPLNLDSVPSELEEVRQLPNLDTVVPELEEVRQLPNLDLVVPELEEVRQLPNPEQLIVDFDESIWEEETDDFDRAIALRTVPFVKRLREEKAIADTDSLQSPPLQENTSPEGEMPETPPLADFATIDWAAQEIVVEDEELPGPEQSVVRQEASGRVDPAAPLGFEPERRIVSPRQLELPLPAPALFIPTSDLAAGETVTVRVKLPPHPARLCIKLWVQDRQSRSLLDGPRWLVDLIPDGAGQLEAMTQLIVPFGSVEIRFEAIAVDLDSQRESHKVAADCVVVPPDLPNISLDEFQT